MTCGAPRSIVWRAYMSRWDRGWETRRWQILRGASFALVWCREERGASTKARNIFIIQVVVAIVYEKLGFIFGPLEFSRVFTHLLGCIGWWLIEEWTPSGWVAEVATAAVGRSRNIVGAQMCLVSIGLTRRARML